MYVPRGLRYCSRVLPQIGRVVVALAVLVAVVAALQPSPARAAAADAFILVPAWDISGNTYAKQQIMHAQVSCDGTQVRAESTASFEYNTYTMDDPTHQHPLHVVGSGSMSMTGTYNPTTYRVEGEYHLEFAAVTTGGWFPSREVSSWDGSFHGVLTGPNNQMQMTVETVWTQQHFTPASGGGWEPFGGESRNQVTEAYTYRQVGGPTPPAAMATVEECGNSWLSLDGGATWQPLAQGAVLRPGSTIRTEDVQDTVAPFLKGGGRAVLVFGKGFRQTIEPNSTVRIFDWGAQVESGSVVVADTPNKPAWASGDTGFVGGKDPGAFQPSPMQAQGLLSAAPASETHVYAAAATAENNYRVEVKPTGMEVAVFSGSVYAKSTVTQAVVELGAGQSATLGSSGLGPVSAKTFTDVTASNPYRTAIVGMALRGIVNGYAAGTAWEFRPLDSVKRAQFAKMIDGVVQLRVTEDIPVPFSDLGPDALDDLYPHEFVAAAAIAEITTGVKPGLFVPYDPIKRAQVVTMIVRAANKVWPGLLDATPAGWSGATSSFSDGTHGASMHSAEYNGLLQGLDGFGTSWDPWKQATRGEVAQMLWNLMTR